jgi:hypothetical protein
MSSSAASHLRLVSSNDKEIDRAEVVRDFRETMTQHLRTHTEGTNVNPDTLLATDYLNHFNEAVMLLQMLPSAPVEIAADLSAWRHETYEQHFLHSGFRNRNLAIAGYRNAPVNVRHAFDTVTGDISGKLAALLQKVQAGLESGDMEAVSHLCAEGIPAIEAQLEVASAIVNGEIEPIDRIQAEGAAETGTHQAAVDKLFD